mgnify:CR=1 FL=1
MSFVQRVNELLNKNMKTPVRVLILAVSGALTGLTLAIPEIGFLEWLTIIPAALILLRRGSADDVKLRFLYLDGLAFFYGYYLVCYHFFLSMYPLDFIDGVTKGTAAAGVAISCAFAIIDGRACILAFSNNFSRQDLPKNRYYKAFFSSGIMVNI